VLLYFRLTGIHFFTLWVLKCDVKVLRFINKIGLNLVENYVNEKHKHAAGHPALCVSFLCGVVLRIGEYRWLAQKVNKIIWSEKQCETTLAPSAFDLLNYHKVCFTNLIIYNQHSYIFYKTCL